MDPLTWSAWALAGAATGLVAGLVPGLHVNALLPGLALLGLSVEAAVAFVPGFATAHAFAAIVPGTFLGVPDPDSGILALPAHSLVQEGRGGLAVRIASRASLAAVVAVCVVLVPTRWVIEEPLRLGLVVAAILPGLMVALVLWMLWCGRRRFAANLAVFVMAATLGLLASRFQPSGVAGPMPPLAPVLAGLFGGASLVAALRHAPLTSQDTTLPRRLGRLAARAGWIGAGISALFVPVSAATPAVMASAIPQRTPEASIATLAGIGVAHQTLAVAMLWATQRPRTQLASALLPLAQAQPWQGGRPTALLLQALLAMLLAALISHGVLLAFLHRPRWSAPRSWAAWATPAALAFLVGMQILGGGWQGFVLFAAATLVGLVPIRLQARRLQLVACLVVPAALRALGLTS